MLEHGRVDEAVRLGHADAADEVADRSGRHAAAAQPRDEGPKQNSLARAQAFGATAQQAPHSSGDLDGLADK